MIIVTAGHVDHGKTSLIEALTGTNADRLPEEKQRGMTIELGYAFMDLSDNQRLAFVDVPGHSKFINTMLAGVSCAKHALLIIACDDGVMPQTSEHLAILQLLNLEHLIVVLTKQDKVDSARIEAVKEEVNQLLSDSHSHCQGNSPVYVVSAQTGQGIAELNQAIKQLSQTRMGELSRTSEQASFRMAIDRVFTVKGAGVVVTGTVISGQVSLGQSLYVSGQSKAVKVRTLHSQGRVSEQAYACQRVALNLTGINQHRGIQRGDWLTALAPLPPPKVICGVFKTCLPFKHWQSVQVHLGNSHTTARIGLLEMLSDNQALVELQCEQVFSCVEQDRIIVRDAAAKTTLGALRVLDIAPPNRGKRSPQRLGYLKTLKESETLSSSLLAQTAAHCVPKSTFIWANQLSADSDLLRLSKSILEVDGYLVSDVLSEQIELQLLTLVSGYHQASPELLGLTINRLQRMTHGQYPLAVLMRACDNLYLKNRLNSTRGLVHLPQHNLSLSIDEQLQWQGIKLQMLTAGGPLWGSDLAQQNNLDLAVVGPLCRKLIQLGYISAIVKDRYVLTERLYFYANVIREQIKTHGEIKTADFNSMIQLGRKASIQLLEFYDRSGLTWRKKKDNSRVIRDSSIFIASDLAEEHRS